MHHDIESVMFVHPYAITIFLFYIFMSYRYSSACGPRILTALLYLSDVEEGGETVFPKLGIDISPKRGRLVIWPGVENTNNNRIDFRTMHGANSVVKGIKYVANFWVHLYDYRTSFKWECTGPY